MNKIIEEFDFLTRLMKGMALQFGKNCEVVLHDYSKPYENTIVAIENGHVTGRKIGDGGTNLGLEVLRGTLENGDKYNYMTQTKSGKLIRSTSIYIKDDNGKAIGAICINWDITEAIMCESFLSEITQSATPKSEVHEVITNDVEELVDELIYESITYVGKPVASMTKEDKIKGLKFLDSKGAFLVKKSGDKIAKFYDISKNTIYNYLEIGE